ncbi:MAG: hypothetical protein NC041_03475 [Bacteroides sp.]|nr:hypothetical protein [Prevotella sp.]MCM1408184.1 hypothetical protein [Treponema brennaborense]MCM1469508.1 hypothetical protein [Bacteroides sp.]
MQSMMTALQNILRIEQDAVSLNMPMSGAEFAKMRLMQHLSDKGYIASCAGGNEYSFVPWNFSHITEQENTLLIKGNATGGGKTAYEILAAKNADSRKIADTVNKIAESAFRQNIALPLCGPAGIICREDGSLLFLPEVYHKRAFAAHGQETYAQYTGFWLNASLSGEKAWRFCIACMAYFCITGTVPFPEIDEAKRAEDLYDSSVMPLEMHPLPMNAQAASSVTAALCAKRETPPSVPVALTAEISDGTDIFQAEKYAQAAKKKRRGILIKRFFRHNAAALFTAAAAVLIAAGILFAVRVNIGSRPTTRGLTAKEVADTFYTAMNTQNAPLMKACLKGSAGKYYLDMISGFYVTNTMRRAYESNTGSIPPAQWLHLRGRTNYWFFGLTHVFADSEQCNTNMPWRTVKAAASIPNPNDGIQKGEEVSFDCSYYIVRHEGLQKIIVTKHTDAMTLCYTGKCWLIASLEGTFVPVETDTAAFNKSYIRLLKENLGIPEIAEKMQADYPWLPDADEVEAAKTLLDKHITELFTSKPLSD